MRVTNLPRSWRNNNPGNVRPLGGSQKWQGQIGLDNAAGGPFAVFEDAAMGFRALALILRTYELKHNLNTVRSMLSRYAPALGRSATGQYTQNTNGYIETVARALGVSPDAPITTRDERTAMAMIDAIARYEGGPRCPVWNPEDMRLGWRLAWRFS